MVSRRDGGREKGSYYKFVFSGNYERLSMESLPPLWLAYLADPSDSGASRYGDIQTVMSNARAFS